MQTCPRCSALIQNGVSFCPSCGNSMGAPMGAASRPTSLNPVGPMVYTNQSETSGKAIASLICGIMSYVILPFFAAIPAIVLGHIALSDIKRSAGRLKGQGMALAGLIMGYLGVVLIPFILIVAAIAIPNLLRARMAANEASAVGALRTYERALVNYGEICPKNGFPRSVANLGPGRGDCDGAGLIGSELAAPEAMRSGYRFSYSPGPADDLGRVTSYTFTADPLTEGTTGTRHFFTDQSGVIRMSRGETATVDSQPIQ